MRTLVAILSLMILAGCASTASAPRTADPGARPAPWPIMAEAPEFMRIVQDRIAARLVDVCGVINTYERSQCLRERLLDGFDESGEARDWCEPEWSPESVSCVLLGSFAYDIARRAQLDAAARFDWSDPGKQYDQVTHQLIDSTVAACRDKGRGGDSACEIHELASRLILDVEQTRTCDALRAIPEAVRCVMNTYFLGLVDAALERMGEPAAQAI